MTLTCKSKQEKTVAYFPIVNIIKRSRSEQLCTFEIQIRPHLKWFDEEHFCSCTDIQIVVLSWIF